MKSEFNERHAAIYNRTRELCKCIEYVETVIKKSNSSLPEEIKVLESFINEPFELTDRIEAQKRIETNENLIQGFENFFDEKIKKVIPSLLNDLATLFADVKDDLIGDPSATVTKEDIEKNYAEKKDNITLLEDISVLTEFLFSLSDKASGLNNQLDNSFLLLKKAITQLSEHLQQIPPAYLEAQNSAYNYIEGFFQKRDMDITELETEQGQKLLAEVIEAFYSETGDPEAIILQFLNTYFPDAMENETKQFIPETASARRILFELAEEEEERNIAEGKNASEAKENETLQTQEIFRTPAFIKSEKEEARNPEPLKGVRAKHKSKKLNKEAPIFYELEAFEEQYQQFLIAAYNHQKEAKKILSSIEELPLLWSDAMSKEQGNELAQVRNFLGEIQSLIKTANELIEAAKILETKKNTLISVLNNGNDTREFEYLISYNSYSKNLIAISYFIQKELIPNLQIVANKAEEILRVINQSEQQSADNTSLEAKVTIFSILKDANFCKSSQRFTDSNDEKVETKEKTIFSFNANLFSFHHYKESFIELSEEQQKRRVPRARMLKF